MLLGLHHVTAFAGDARTNLDFYTQVMGLRLIKRTVNFDDPGTYHFYFGDAEGTPGSILTFFPWPTAPPRRNGAGQAAGVSFSIPRNALDAWIDRLKRAGVGVVHRAYRFEQEFIEFSDPHGLKIELFASAPESDDPSILRLHSPTLCEAVEERTAEILRNTLGFSCVSREGDRTRFDLLSVRDQSANRLHTSSTLDILSMPGVERGRISSGVVHHIAWRVADEVEQLQWRAKLIDAGLRVTRVIDRQYFKSIYFREPGGVLFEIATDGPGFFVDEPELGVSLKLPPWLEPIRESIERRLPEI